MSAANTDLPGLLSVAGTTLGTVATTGPLTNADGRGVKVQLNVTAFSAGSVVVTVQGIIQGVPYTILASAVIVATGVTILTVYPGLVAAANVTVNDIVPRQWAVTITPTGFTGAAQVGACLIV